MIFIHDKYFVHIVQGNCTIGQNIHMNENHAAITFPKRVSRTFIDTYGRVLELDWNILHETRATEAEW